MTTNMTHEQLVAHREAMSHSVHGSRGYEPEWNCSDCGASRNWSCRHRCRKCGAWKYGTSVSQKSKEEQTKLSKALTLILRHTAVDDGIQIRPDGFCRVSEVMAHKLISRKGTRLADITAIVEVSDKQRFELRYIDGVQFIRAAQGHSLNEVVADDLLTRLHSEDRDLPILCVHVTDCRNVENIIRKGFLAGGTKEGYRNHVHFTSDEALVKGLISGRRNMYKVAIYLDLKRAIKDGIAFYISANKVILTAGINGVVPAEYIDKIFEI